MAQTTTAISACDAVIYLDDDLGAPHNISGSSNQVDMNFEQSIAEFTTFEGRWPVRQECGKDASFSLQVIYSTAADESFDLLKTWFFAESPGRRTMTVYLPDEQVGSDRYEGEVRISSLTWSVSRGDAGPIVVTAELLPDGEFARMTVAS